MKKLILCAVVTCPLIGATATPLHEKIDDQTLKPLVCAKATPNKYYVSYAVVLEGGKGMTSNYACVCTDKLGDTQSGLDDVILKLKSDERERRGKDGFLTVLSVMSLKQ